MDVFVMMIQNLMMQITVKMKKILAPFKQLKMLLNLLLGQLMVLIEKYV